jgi:hypothetical protein
MDTLDLRITVAGTGRHDRIVRALNGACRSVSDSRHKRIYASCVSSEALRDIADALDAANSDTGKQR